MLQHIYNNQFLILQVLCNITFMKVYCYFKGLVWRIVLPFKFKDLP